MSVTREQYLLAHLEYPLKEGDIVEFLNPDMVIPEGYASVGCPEMAKWAEIIRELSRGNNRGRIEAKRPSWYEIKSCETSAAFCAPYFLLKKAEITKADLKPFDCVLVRNNEKQNWTAAIFSHEDTDNNEYIYNAGGIVWKYCIPYKDNEHLLGTNSAPRE